MKTFTEEHKLCCIVNEMIRCPFCEYFTCAECEEGPDDSHTLGDVLRKVNIWYCPKATVLLQVHREPKLHLGIFVPTEVLSGHQSNLAIQAQLERSRPCV